MKRNVWVLTVDLSDVWPEDGEDKGSQKSMLAVAKAFKERSGDWAKVNPIIPHIADNLQDFAEENDLDAFDDAWATSERLDGSDVRFLPIALSPIRIEDYR